LSNIQALQVVVKKNLTGISDFLGKEISIDLFRQATFAMIEKNPRLAECDPKSFVEALSACARLRLIPDGQDASLVPYGKKATFILGYFGALKLAYRNDRISHVSAGVVYEEDVEFAFVDGTNPSITHVKGPKGWSEDANKKETFNPIICAYAIVFLKDATFPIIKILQRWEIDRIRDVSPAKSQGPWVKWFPEMAMKTAIKQALKTAPKSDDLMRAYQIDEVPDAFDAEFESYNNQTIKKMDPRISENTEENELPQDTNVETKNEETTAEKTPDPPKSTDKEETQIILDVDQGQKIKNLMISPGVDTVEVMTYMMTTYSVTDSDELKPEQAEAYLNYLSQKVF